MRKLHLNYYELSKETQEELKRLIMEDIEISGHKDKETNKIKIDKLFELNNAGIDIDIYQWMAYKK